MNKIMFVIIFKLSILSKLINYGNDEFKDVGWWIESHQMSCPCRKCFWTPLKSVDESYETISPTKLSYNFKNDTVYVHKVDGLWLAKEFKILVFCYEVVNERVSS